MTIGEICTRKVIIAPRGTSVYEAAKLMREYHTGDVVVTDDYDGARKPVGMVTGLVLEIDSYSEESAAGSIDATPFQRG